MAILGKKETPVRTMADSWATCDAGSLRIRTRSEQLGRTLSGLQSQRQIVFCALGLACC